MKLALFVAAFSISMPASAESLHLICMGAGHANKDDDSYAYAGSSNGQTAWARMEGTTAVQFADQVNVDIDGATGRIRMPRTMLPPIHGGKDGWMDIEKLTIGEREITGSVGVNFINSPKLRIDRVTGVLSLAGKSGGFTGQCKPYDPATVQRAF